MSLDVTLRVPGMVQIFDSNITHNLGKMAHEAGIYMHLWRPSEIGIRHAEELIKPLEAGLAKLRENPDHFKKFNPENGWGDYDLLVRFVEEYRDACQMYPQAEVEADI